MTEYELTLVVSPKLTDEQREELNNEFKKKIGSSATIEKEEDWGRKQTAYSIKKNDTANYLHFHLKTTKNTLVKDISAHLRVDNRVLRFLVIKKT